MTDGRGASRRSQIATAIGAAFLLVQAGFVVYAHAVQPFTSGNGARAALDGCSAEQHGCTRYFAWAPNDYFVTYQLAVTVDGRALDSIDAFARYRLAGDRWEFPVEQLEDIIRQYETTYGKGQHATVRLTYRMNGRPAQVWTWND